MISNRLEYLYSKNNISNILLYGENKIGKNIIRKNINTYLQNK